MHEERTWREKCTANEKGEIVIPAMAFKQALDGVAKRLGDQIPGKGKSTYTKHFVGGVICEEDVVLPGCRKEDCPSITISANSDGVRGSGKRVDRTFPQWPKWGGKARFVIMDDASDARGFRAALSRSRTVRRDRPVPARKGRPQRAISADPVRLARYLIWPLVAPRRSAPRRNATHLPAAALRQAPPRFATQRNDPPHAPSNPRGSTYHPCLLRGGTDPLMERPARLIFIGRQCPICNGQGQNCAGCGAEHAGPFCAECLEQLQ